jgi:hypothetical protein
MSVTSTTTRAQDGSGDATYRTSRGQRALSASGAAVMLLVAALELAGLGGPPETDVLVAYAFGVGITLLGAVHGFKMTIQVGDGMIKKRRPLWTDKTLRLREVRRVHFPTIQSGLWLYTDPSGDPALTLEGHFERFGALAVQVAGQLPDEAEITDPAGKLREYRRENGDAGEGE